MWVEDGLRQANGHTTQGVAVVVIVRNILRKTIYCVYASINICSGTNTRLRQKDGPSELLVIRVRVKRNIACGFHGCNSTIGEVDSGCVVNACKSDALIR